MTKEEIANFLQAKKASSDYINTLEHIPKEIYTYVHLITVNMDTNELDNKLANSPFKSGFNTNDEYGTGYYDEMQRKKEEQAKEEKDIPELATGRILTKPLYALVGEAGPEAIIPLSGTNRERGKELWYQAGDSLGMFEEQRETPKPYVQQSRFSILSEETKAQNAVSPVSVNLESLGGINITINGGTDINNSKAIIATIRKEMPTIADDLCVQIASMLKKAFDNMPLTSS